MGIEDAALKCFKSYQSEINVVFISNQTSNEHHVDLGVVQISEQHCCIFLGKIGKTSSRLWILWTCTNSVLVWSEQTDLLWMFMEQIIPYNSFIAT